MQLAQPCRHTTSEAFQAVKGLCYVINIRYDIWNVASAREWVFITQIICW